MLACFVCLKTAPSFCVVSNNPRPELFGIARSIMWPDEALLDDQGESAGSEGGGECFGEVLSTSGDRSESSAPDCSGGKGDRPTLTEGDEGLLGARDEWEMMTPDEQVCGTCSRCLFDRHSGISKGAILFFGTEVVC